MHLIWKADLTQRKAAQDPMSSGSSVIILAWFPHGSPGQPSRSPPARSPSCPRPGASAHRGFTTRPAHSFPAAPIPPGRIFSALSSHRGRMTLPFLAARPPSRALRSRGGRRVPDKLQPWSPAQAQRRRKAQDTQPRAGHMAPCPGTKRGHSEVTAESLKEGLFPDEWAG